MIATLIQQQITWLLRRASIAISGACLVLMLSQAFASDRPPVSSRFQPISIEECLRLALLNNRELQVQRFNPPIAKSWLAASQGYYDPTFLTEARGESAANSGGFDPTDFSRDAIYSADSTVVRSGLTGVGPGGFTYALGGDYAYSHGFRNGFNFESYSLFVGVSARQPLLRNFWTDQGRTLISINRKNLRITELGVMHLTMDIINRVHQAYFELAFAGSQLEVREKLRDSRQRFLAGIQRRIELGTLTILDEQLAQSELARVETELSVARNAVVLAGNLLRTLIGDRWTNSLAAPLSAADPLIVVPQPFDLQESWMQGAESRCDLQQLRIDVEKAEIDLRYRRNQLFPSLDLIAGYGRRGSSTDQVLPPLTPSASLDAAYHQITGGDEPNDVLGVSFSVPLGRVAERGNFRASKELKVQAETRLRQFEELVFREIADAIDTASSNLERVGRARFSREMAAAALDAEERKLEGGKSTIFVVLQLQGQLATAQSTELRAKADYNRAVSQLHFAEGSLLDQLRLQLNFD